MDMQYFSYCEGLTMTPRSSTDSSAVRPGARDAHHPAGNGSSLDPDGDRERRSPAWPATPANSPAARTSVWPAVWPSTASPTATAPSREDLRPLFGFSRPPATPGGARCGGLRHCVSCSTTAHAGPAGRLQGVAPGAGISPNEDSERAATAHSAMYESIRTRRRCWTTGRRLHRRTRRSWAVPGAHGIRPARPGGRSILGDARSPRDAVHMNLKIKFRESFRPFAPSYLGNGPATTSSSTPTPSR